MAAGTGAGWPAPRSCCSARARCRAALFHRGRAADGRARRWRRCCSSAAEAAALARGCRAIRLEVHQTNHAAIARYRKSGYRRIRPPSPTTTRTAAMRCGSRSGCVPDPAALAAAPPYFHQTTEFTCGPACIMMALAWADRMLQAGARLRVPALARSHHHLHRLGAGRLRALRHGGRAQASRPRAGDLCQPAPGPISSRP